MPRAASPTGCGWICYAARLGSRPGAGVAVTVLLDQPLVCHEVPKAIICVGMSLEALVPGGACEPVQGIIRMGEVGSAMLPLAIFPVQYIQTYTISHIFFRKIIRLSHIIMVLRHC